MRALVPLLLAASLFAGCDLLLDERGYTKLRTDPGGINNYDLEYYVPIPVAGEKPRGLSKEEYFWGGLAITAEWFISNDSGDPDSYSYQEGDFKFKKGLTYFAEITLRLEDGYYWDNGANHILSYAKNKVAWCRGGALDNEDSWERTVKVLYNKTEENSGGGNDVYVPVITDYNLQHYVPVPKTGTEPVKEITGRADVEGSVIWKEGETDLTDSLKGFTRGEVYKAEITLKAKAGYVFDENIPFMYPGDDPEVEGDDGDTTTRTLAVIYDAAADPQPISSVDLSNLIARPVMGASPITDFSAGTYTGEVTWEPGGGDSFGADTEYTATVTLKPATGYDFVFGELLVTHTGATPTDAAFFGSDPAGTRSGSITFPAVEGTPISGSINLAPHIPKPVPNEMPVMSFSVGTCTGTVVWTETGNDPDPLNGLFQADTAYTADVTLTPAPGYYFPASNLTVTHSDADPKSVEFNKKAGSGESARSGNIDFPATVQDTPITGSIDLTLHIPAPVEGKRPVTDLDISSSSPPAQYTAGKVSWTPQHGIFLAGRAYKAAVTLTAKPGYTFTGAKGRFFHAEGGISVSSNSGGTVTLSIEFEQLYKDPNIGGTWYVDADKGSDTLNGGGSNPGTSRKWINGSGAEVLYTSNEAVNGPFATINRALTEAATIAKLGQTGSWQDGVSAKIVLLSDLLVPDGGGSSATNPITKIGPITKDLADGDSDNDYPPIILCSDTSAPTPYTISMNEESTEGAKILLSVEKGGKLTLKDITLKYKRLDNVTPASVNISLVKVDGPGAELFFESGVSILNAKSGGDDSFGSGVRVEGGAVFTMNKGIIEDNTGASSVCVDDSTFEMNGGTIKGNTERHGVIVRRSTFKMYGGTIEQNNGGGNNGGGVFVENSTFEMNGGIIGQKNNADSRGGGVYVNGDSIFKMSGGTIRGNVGEDGGGVYVDGGTFTKTGGVIYGSEAEEGLKNEAPSGSAVGDTTNGNRAETLWEDDDWPLPPNP